jgi:glycosyltransferase involved in cell wall biosynthesis
VAETWERDATVIYPPVEVRRFIAEDAPLDAEDLQIVDSLPGDYLLGFSRFIPYKHLELVIDAGVAADLPVVLAGDGPEEPRLRAYAESKRANVTFVIHPSFALLRQLYRLALALVFAPIEDFGIVPVEAMALGTPVVANAVGGAAETVVDGVTGTHVHEWTPAALHEAIHRASTAQPEDCRSRALQFDTRVFVRELRTWVEGQLA